MGDYQTESHYKLDNKKNTKGKTQALILLQNYRASSRCSTKLMINKIVKMIKREMIKIKKRIKGYEERRIYLINHLSFLI